MNSNVSQPASSLDNYKPMMDERAELYEQKKAIDARIEELDEALRPSLADRGELIHNGYSFKVDITAGRKTVDYKQMAADFGIDLDAYTKQGAPSTRFSIKKVNQL